MDSQRNQIMPIPVFWLLGYLVVTVFCWDPFGEYPADTDWLIWLRVAGVLGACLLLVLGRLHRLNFWFLASIGILSFSLASDIASGTVMPCRVALRTTAALQVIWLICTIAIALRRHYQSRMSARGETASGNAALILRKCSGAASFSAGILWLLFLGSSCWFFLAIRNEFAQPYRDMLYIVSGLSIFAFIIVALISLVLRAVAFVSEPKNAEDTRGSA